MKQKADCCPTCGRTMTKAKIAPVADLDLMTPDQRRAYFHKIAPVEDVRRGLRFGLDLSPDLRADWEALAGQSATLPRAQVYRRLWSLKDRWGFESAAFERAHGIPAVGSPAWHTVNRFQDILSDGVWVAAEPAAECAA